MQPHNTITATSVNCTDGPVKETNKSAPNIYPEDCIRYVGGGKDPASYTVDTERAGYLLHRILGWSPAKMLKKWGHSWLAYTPAEWAKLMAWTPTKAERAIAMLRKVDGVITRRGHFGDGVRLYISLVPDMSSRVRAMKTEMRKRTAANVVMLKYPKIEGVHSVKIAEIHSPNIEEIESPKQVAIHNTNKSEQQIGTNEKNPWPQGGEEIADLEKEKGGKNEIMPCKESPPTPQPISALRAHWYGALQAQGHEVHTDPADLGKLKKVVEVCQPNAIDPVALLTRVVETWGKSGGFDCFAYDLLGQEAYNPPTAPHLGYVVKHRAALPGFMASLIKPNIDPFAKAKALQKGKV